MITPPKNKTHLHRLLRLVLADHAQLVLLLRAVPHVPLFSHGAGHPLAVRVPSQGGHRGPAHGLVLFPVLPLAVGVAVVGLGALPALGQVVAVLAAVEALEDGDPKGLLRAFLLRVVVGDNIALLRGAAITSALIGGRGGGGGVVARGAVAVFCGVAHEVMMLSGWGYEIQIQKEQQKVDWWISNFDPIDGDLPGLVHSKTRRI